MAYEIERIHAEQDLIVRDLFVDTADDNYIAARWCFVEGLNVDYFWLSVHALEKYMCSAPGSLDTSLSHAAGLIEIAACHA